MEGALLSRLEVDGRRIAAGPAAPPFRSPLPLFGDTMEDFWLVARLVVVS
jgi:hypothetical protein